MNTFFLDSKCWLRYNLLCCKYLDILYPHTRTGTSTSKVCLPVLGTGKLPSTVSTGNVKIVISCTTYTLSYIPYRVWYCILLLFVVSFQCTGTVVGRDHGN